MGPQAWHVRCHPPVVQRPELLVGVRIVVLLLQGVLRLADVRGELDIVLVLPLKLDPRLAELIGRGGEALLLHALRPERVVLRARHHPDHVDVGGITGKAGVLPSVPEGIGRATGTLVPAGAVPPGGRVLPSLGGRAPGGPAGRRICRRSCPATLSLGRARVLTGREERRAHHRRREQPRPCHWTDRGQGASNGRGTQVRWKISNAS